MSPASDDPLVRLEHDHSQVSALVGALREALAAARAARGAPELQPEILEALRALRDELFTHFALEEEGLFPLVVRELPELSRVVEAVVGSHDRLCGAVSRMTYLADKGPDALAAELDALTSLFGRFEEAYTDHARDELELLRTLATRLGAAQRAAVAKVLAEL